nr:aquaporin [Sporocytophaga sp.]
MTHAGIAVTFGLIVMSMIYALGDISGAHLNPAVSFAFWTKQMLPLPEFVKYLAGQVTGAFLASTVLRLLFKESKLLGSTLPAGSDFQSFVLEIILAFLLLFVIAQVATGTKEKGIMAGIAIASVVMLEAMFAGPITGASMNPARSLAPAILSGNTQSLWIYLTAPFIGAYLGIKCSAYIQNDNQNDSDKKSHILERTGNNQKTFQRI